MPLDALVTGRIATLAGEAGFGWVEAVGIKDGRVAFAGSAIELETRHPEIITAEYRKVKRPHGRVLVDYNQKAWGRTLA